MQFRSRLFSRREVFTPTDGVSDVSYPVNPTFTFAKALHCVALVISNAINLLTKELKHPHFIKANIRPNRQWLFLVGLVIAITTGASHKAVAECADNIQQSAFAAPIPGSGPYSVSSQFMLTYNRMTGALAGSTFRLTATGYYSTWVTVRKGSATGALVAQGYTPLNWTASAGGNYFIHYNVGPSGCDQNFTPFTSGVENTTPCANTFQYPESAFASPIKGVGPDTITTAQYQEEYNQMTGALAGNTFQSTASIAGTWITVRAGTVTGALVAQGSSPLNWTASAGGSYFTHYNTNSACGTANTDMTSTVENTTPVCANNYQFPNLDFVASPIKGAGPYTITNAQTQSTYNQMTGALAGSTFQSTAGIEGTWITVRAGTVTGAVVAQGSTPLNWTASAGGTYFIHYNTNSTCGTSIAPMTSRIENTTPVCANTFQYPAAFASPIKGAGPYTITTAQTQSQHNQMTGALAGNTFQSSASITGTWITVRAGTVTGALVAQGSTPLNWTASAGGNYFIHYNTNSACGTANTSMTSRVDNTTPVCANTFQFPTSAFASPIKGVGPFTITTEQHQSEYNQMTGALAGNSFQSTASIEGTWITVRSGAFDGALVAQGITPLNWIAASEGTYFIHYNTNSACGTANTGMTSTVENTTPVCANTFQYPAAFASPIKGAGPYTITTAQTTSHYNQMTGALAGSTFQSSASIAGTWITVRSGAFDGAVVAEGFVPLNWIAASEGTYFIHYNSNSACGTDGDYMVSTVENTTPACANIIQNPEAFAAPTKGEGPYPIANEQLHGEYNQMTGVSAGNSFQSTASIAGTWITVRSGAFDGVLVAEGITPLNWIAASEGTYFIHYNTNSACGTDNTNMTSTVENTTPCANIIQNPEAFAAPIKGEGPYPIVNEQLHGDYNQMTGALAGNTFQSTASIDGTWITVRSNAFDGALVAEGISPLNWIAASEGTYFIHYNTNSECGTDNTPMTSTVENTTPDCANIEQWPEAFAAPIEGTGYYIIDYGQFNGQYNQMTDALAGNSFRSSAAIAGTWITVRSGTFDGAVVAEGITPLNWIAASEGTYFIHYNTNSECGTDGDYTVSTVKNTTSACTNSNQNPEAFAAPTKGEGPYPIANEQLHGDYNQMTGVSAGNSFQSTASIAGTWISVRSGAFDGELVAKGITPLNWIAASEGTYFIHYNTNSLCGTDNTPMISTVENTTPACTNIIQNPEAFAAPIEGEGPYTIANEQLHGEYNQMTGVSAGNSFQSTASIAGTWITVRSGAFDGAFVAQGISPLNWIAASEGTYFIHYNTNSECGTDNTAMTSTVENTTPDCTNSSQYPESAFAAPIGGEGPYLNYGQYHGDYNNMTGVLAGSTFQSTASIAGTWISVRSGAFDGALVAQGITPLNWIAASEGTYFIHYNTNSACGTDNTPMTSTVENTTPDCANIIQNPEAFVAPIKGAGPYPIGDEQLYGEYNQMTSVEAGNSFQSAASIAGTYITVRSGAFDGAVVAEGITPLNWIAASEGTYFIHYNTNSACGTDDGTAMFTSVENIDCSISSSYATETIIACGSYYWNGNYYGASNNIDTWTGTNAAGCDSTVTLNLTINQPSYATETIVACDSYDWHGNTYTSSNNTATWTGQNAAGCDSTVTLNLTIIIPTATVAGNTSFCAGGNTQLTANATSDGRLNVTAIAAGAGLSLFLENDGTVWATGYNEFGQLGDGTNESKNIRVQVSGLSDITAISGVGYHSLFSKNDGTVWATGNNYFGALGDGTNESKITPVQLSGLSEITAVSAGESHSLFLKNDSTVWATGYNIYGQLGDGTLESKNTPIQVSGLSEITAVSAGPDHSLFLKNDGTVWATGNNYFGELGDGTNESKNTPVQVSGLSEITAVSAGLRHSLFLKNDSTVWATGNNYFGQLGDGTIEDKNTPVQVSGLSDITAISGGRYHSLFLKNDGTVQATGENYFGQLGDGTNEDKNTPVQVSGLSDITAISAGYSHSLFLQNDGKVQATGSNYNGQFGDGTYGYKNTPVYINVTDVTITSYQWNLNGTEIAGANSATYTANAPGNYTVVVTNSNDCSVTSESVIVAVNQPITSTETITACGSYAWHDSTYTASTNTATWVGINAAGCDSIVTLNLTINNLSNWYLDADGDGYYVNVVSACSLPGEGYSTLEGTDGDCDDSDASVWRFGIFFNDNDGDGYGSPSSATATCYGANTPSGFSINSDDCFDSNSNINPGATEICNGIDDNCDGIVDFGPFGTPTSVNGPTAVCRNQSFVFTTDVVEGATSYQWTLPSNATGTSTSNSISVTFASTFTGGSICVKAVNQCGPSAQVCKTLTVITATSATPGTISGTASVCVNSTENTYTIAAVANASNYIWTAPSNATLVSGQGTTTATFSFQSAFTTGSISVRSSNCFGTSAARTLTVAKKAISATPGTVTGPASFCPGTQQTFSIAAVTGASDYTWTAPANASIVSGQDSLSVLIEFTSAFVSGNVTVVSSNCSGTSAARTKAVTRTAVSATPGTVTGPATVCTNTQQTFSIAAVTGASNYTWTAPAGANILSGQGGLSVVVEFTSAYVSGNLTVVSSNCSGTSAARTKAVAKKALPGTVGAISGATAGICSGNTRTYTVAALSNTTSYEWIAPVNTSIVSGQGNTSVVVQFADGFTTGTLSVRGVNCSGTSVTARTLALTNVTATPTVLNGPSTGVCAGTTQTYSTTAVAGATSYVWAVPTGAVINSGQGSTSISVTFPTPFISGAITVRSATTCYTSAAKSLTVRSALAQPGVIAGTSNNLCAGGSFTYTIAAVTGATGYFWNVPAGWIITANTGTSITVSIPTTGFTSAAISVAAQNACGYGTARSLTLSALPASPTAITGSTSVCPSATDLVYSTTAVAGVNYTWTVPTGATITSGQGTGSVVVNWGTVAGSVSVKASNACGNNTTARTLAVSLADCRSFEIVAEETSVETAIGTELNVYPNPTTGEARITFSTTAAGQYAISIVDLQGRVITGTSGAAIEGNNTLDINLSNCSNGVYMIHLMHSDTLQTLRVVKM